MIWCFGCLTQLFATWCNPNFVFFVSFFTFKIFSLLTFPNQGKYLEIFLLKFNNFFLTFLTITPLSCCRINCLFNLEHFTLHISKSKTNFTAFKLHKIIKVCRKIARVKIDNRHLQAGLPVPPSLDVYPLCLFYEKLSLNNF